MLLWLVHCTVVNTTIKIYYQFSTVLTSIPRTRKIPAMFTRRVSPTSSFVVTAFFILLSGLQEARGCYTIDFNGRLGNLMFQYGAVIGLCAKQNMSLSSCAYIKNPEFWDSGCPVRTLVHTFNLFKSPINGCILTSTYTEHGGHTNDIKFDPNVLLQPLGTALVGYYQGWQYFDHARPLIKQTYTFPAAVQHEASRFIYSVRENCPNLNCKVVGVHIRLGDKLHMNWYNSWALSSAYYLKAMNIVMHRHSSSNLMFVFFVGGSETNNDVHEHEPWVISHIAKPLNLSSDQMFIEKSNDHLIALQSLMICDIIITASSSFSWWGAYLSDSMEIYAPRNLFEKGSANEMHVEVEDYYPPFWTWLSEDPHEDRIIGWA